MVAAAPSHSADEEVLDAIIVGGGPAGLSAALVLGRCLRRVLVCDAGHPRNEPARIFNGCSDPRSRAISAPVSRASPLSLIVLVIFLLVLAVLCSMGTYPILFTMKTESGAESR
jgi:choline dehydrogenase-like flavoprotein